MSLLRKRYDMIADPIKTAPKVHYNYAERIITLNSPKAIITAHLLYGRCAYISGAKRRRIFLPILRSIPDLQSAAVISRELSSVLIKLSCASRTARHP